MSIRSAEELETDITDNVDVQQKKLKLDREVLGIVESDVGITQYLSPDLEGFSGTLKQRYTDFLVNEIDTMGNVVHLTDLGFGDKKDRRRERRQKERDDETDQIADTTNSGQSVQLETAEHSEEAEVVKQLEISEPNKANDQDASLIETTESAKTTEPIVQKPPFELEAKYRIQLLELLGEETVQKFIDLLSTGTKLETTKSFDSKTDRTAIHQLVRNAFNSKLETRTTPQNTFIVTLSGGSNRRRGQQDQERDAGRGQKSENDSSIGPVKEFIHFTVYKENKETMEVANLISKFLRIPPKAIAYAGTKDRRGVTVQRASLCKVKLERINGLNKTLRGIKLGGYTYESSPLRLGDLKGNEFIITIRDVEASSKDVIDRAMKSLKDNGFINYFGMQRFGTFSISTHSVGIHILKSDWPKVVDLILSPQELAVKESVEARQVWKETGNASKAFSLMPRKCAAEYSLLRALSQDSKAYLDAVAQIPRNLRVMYGHAYQSYIWNTVASERIKRFGMNIMAGDLVLENNKDVEARSEQDGEQVPEEDLKQDRFIRARPVTQKEIDDGTKTAFDVVLPTPGFDVLYPDNELKQVYIDVMAHDGLDPMNMRRSIREFSLAGSYRFLLAKPEVVEWRIRKYEEPYEQMVKTDLELLQESLDLSNQILSDEGEGHRLAVVLKLQLGTAQYATMALREVMKVDTSRRSESLNVRQHNEVKEQL